MFFIITMYFGGGLVPTYLVVKQTGLINNMWALFLPGGVGVGNMIIVHNYFQNSIPGSLMQASGCPSPRTRPRPGSARAPASSRAPMRSGAPS